MTIRLICVAKKLPDWLEMGYTFYTERLPKHLKPHCVILPVSSKIKEGEQILQLIEPKDTVIALAIEGQSWSSTALSAKIAHCLQHHPQLTFLIGGPEGLSQGSLTRANIHWSLSPLTLPHGLARIILAEQLYRAYTLQINHPYHR